MLDSWRVAEDLMSAYDVKTGKGLGYDVNIVVRGWNPKIEPKAEFRGFVIGKTLTCVGQYWHHLYFPAPNSIPLNYLALPYWYRF